eukprot:g62.t1
MSQPCAIGCAQTGIQLIVAAPPPAAGATGWTQPKTWQWSSHALPGWAEGLTWPTGAAVAGADGTAPVPADARAGAGGAGSAGPYLYLLGRDHAGTAGWPALLGRVPLGALLGGDKAWAAALQFWGADASAPPATPPSWRALPGAGGIRALRLAPIFDGAPPETSLHWSGAMERWTVLSIPFGSDELQIRWAERLTGPWSAPETIYTLPPPFSLSPVFAYSPKVHPELASAPAAASAPGVAEMVVTFMSNSVNASFVRAHTEVYVPQPVRVWVSVVD